MMKNYRNTDPEFAERVEHFAFDEVVNEPGQQLDEVTRHMAILATLLGCQGTEVFRRELPQALDAGVTPVMAKEIVYQAVDYLGMGRVLPFLDITNEVLTARGVVLPLEGQATTTIENRLEKGAQGGCEPQLTSHAKGNMNLGNDKDFLIQVVSQCLPYIGYPRSLNAVTCVNKAAEG